jgi:hypothetical protein
MMTKDELRAKYTVAYKIIQREQRLRDRDFPPGYPRRDEMLGEMRRLLEIVTEMKDELKARMAADAHQPTLLDVPRKVNYG